MEKLISNELKTNKILKYVLPSIIMMLFTSLYTMADGFFASNLINTNALSAINIVFPFSGIMLAIGIMLGTGGSAIISKKLGEKKEEDARNTFTQIVVFAIIIGVIISIFARIMINPLINFLGASDILYKYCYDYLKFIAVFSVANLLQSMFQMMFLTAGKPKMGLYITIIGGISNIVLDYIFIHICNLGITGASLATVIGQLLVATYGILYFSFSNGTLHFIKFKWNARDMLNTLFNGSSEMVTNIALSITTLLFNIVIMKYLGEDGVAAMTIVLYTQFVFSAIYMGFSNGIAPVESFIYGTKNTQNLQKIYRICIRIIVISSIIMCILSFILAPLIVEIFASKGSNVYNIAVQGCYLFCINFMFSGINIYASSFFTALSNGKVSALISFMRTFVFIIISILLLPKLLGLNGVWLSIPVAEICSIIVTIVCLKKYRKVYQY